MTMVRPVHSKRKLFNGLKEQKENEPVTDWVNRPASGQPSLPARNSGNHTTSNRPSGSVGILQGSIGGNNLGGNRAPGLSSGALGEDALKTPGRQVMPVSERQQIALLMQMSSPSPPSTDKCEWTTKLASPHTPSTPLFGRGVNKRNERGETPLHVAAIKGDSERVAQLISLGADVNAADYAGWSALHEASNRGFFSIAKLLIEANASVDAKGLDNDTPLHDACVNNHKQLAHLLLSHGASIRVINSRGKTPLDVCRSPSIATLINHTVQGTLPPVDYLSSDTEPSNALLMSTESGNSGIESPSQSSLSAPPVQSPDSQTGTAIPVSEANQPTTTIEPMMDKVEDIYEFKVKPEAIRVEKAEGEEGGSPPQVGGKEVATVTEEKGEKRIREGGEDEEEGKKKRKREEKNSSKAAKASVIRSSGPSPPTVSSKPPTPPTQLGAVERKSSAGSAANSPKSLPASRGDSDHEEDPKGIESSLKVPPLKIVLMTNNASTASGNGAEPALETSSRNGKLFGNGNRQYIVNSDEAPPEGGVGTPPSEPGCTNTPPNGRTEEGDEKGPNGNRVTRSHLKPGQGGGSSSSEETSGVSVNAIQNVNKTTESKVEECSTVVPSTSCATGGDAILHPRKRKIRLKEPETVSEAAPVLVCASEQPIISCYQSFLEIRKQVERRRESLRPVTPKPPQGFKDYLMNRCTYVLAGNAHSRLSVPLMTPPAGLLPPLKDLFGEQEKERYRLRLQHLIEKEKLVLSVEQEILRVHGRAARALANQALPFSVCTLLKDEEVYNIIPPEQEKDNNSRSSRYNGRLFLSWLQDVDDKWEKIKEAMVLRHHNEAEALHAVQRMDWEWKVKEAVVLSEGVEIHSQRVNPIDEAQVPMVHVSEDFDLLPA